MLRPDTLHKQTLPEVARNLDWPSRTGGRKASDAVDPQRLHPRSNVSGAATHLLLDVLRSPDPYLQGFRVELRVMRRITFLCRRLSLLVVVLHKTQAITKLESSPNSCTPNTRRSHVYLPKILSFLLCLHSSPGQKQMIEKTSRFVSSQSKKK